LTRDFLKKNIKGMSLVIMIMLIAVFSVFIIGTYTILNRHVSNTVDSEADNGAYYTGEGVLRITSTEIDKLAYKISNDANINEEVLTRDEFVTRLNATIASQVDNYFVSKIEPGSFAEYNIDSVTVVPSSLTSDEYTCLYDITAIISNDRNTRKKITGTYGVLYLTESSQSTHTSVMIINESTPMLTAIENITSESMVSLNGNAKLTGDFSYPGHYNAATDAEHYQNNGNRFEVDTTSLIRGNVKIPEVPSPPFEGDKDQITRDNPIGNSLVSYLYSSQIPVLNVPFNAPTYYSGGRNVERVDCLIGGGATIDDPFVFNINENAHRGFFLSYQDIIVQNEFVINVNCDGFVFEAGNLKADVNGKLIINTNGHDIFFKFRNLEFTDETKQMNITTTGTGNVYMYFDFVKANTVNDLVVNSCIEGSFNIVFTNNLRVDNESKKLIFKLNIPEGKKESGDFNLFVVNKKDNPNAEIIFGIWKTGVMVFDGPAGTHLNIIADRLHMQGDLQIIGNPGLNFYARKKCEFDGARVSGQDWWHYPPIAALSNYTFKDEEGNVYTDDSFLTENEKAVKIIDTGLNVYYYGTEALNIKHYKCCGNFYSANSANINIENCIFYGNIFSSAPNPERNQHRFLLNFKNSDLSC
jgi:hypothetical protein